jgi:1-acyl-sn-glycerol-3-phosphate acyltransferase
MNSAPPLDAPRVSRGALRFFTRYTRGYLRRHFHGFRILNAAVPSGQIPGPLVIYLNHAAWWDPLVCLMLAEEYFPRRTSYAPIDAAMLTRYGFFRRLGFFGVEQGTARGGLAFLRTARALLAAPGNAVWLTPQGRFTDVRARPIRLQEGLGALAAREHGATFVPLAIEYAFWTEPRPEILVAFGDPVTSRDVPTRSPAEWTQFFATALETTQDRLAAHSLARNVEEWTPVLRGSNGIHKVYDGWRWLRARFRRERFVSAHQPDLS